MNLLEIYKKSVTEKRTLVKTLLIDSKPSLLTAQITIPFDKLPSIYIWVISSWNKFEEKAQFEVAWMYLQCCGSKKILIIVHNSYINSMYVIYCNAKNFDKLQNNTIKLWFKEQLNKEQLGKSAPLTVRPELSLSKFSCT